MEGEAMTESLPARPETSVSARAASAQPGLRDRLLKATGGPTLRAIARIPDRIKRVLLRRRSVTIDGNTLDTTLQLALAVQRLSGREGLILSTDVATARTRLNLTASQFPRTEV